MRNKTKIVSIVLFLSAFIMVISFGGQKAEWKGKIEYEDGIKVIKNPRDPLYGEITFELEEDLSIGREDDENYMFYDFVMPGVDSEGNIFILDHGNCRIQKYDKTGNYLQTIGRKGQGPGEFEEPWGIYLDSEDKIYIYDSIRYNISFFGKNGNFKRVIRLPSFTYDFGITKNKNVLMIYTSRSPDKSREGKRSLVLINPEGNIIKIIASYPYQLRPRIKGHMPSNPYSHKLYFFPASDGGGVYGHSSEYKLFVLDSSGNLNYMIEMDKPPEPIIKKDKNKLIDRYLERQKLFPIGEKLSRSEVKRTYIFPKFKPLFLGIISDDKGRIYIRGYDPDDSSAYFDLFNKEGYYIYKIKAPLYPRIIKKGYVYLVKRDPGTDYVKVKRYKIKNWKQIKEGI